MRTFDPFISPNHLPPVNPERGELSQWARCEIEYRFNELKADRWETDAFDDTAALNELIFLLLNATNDGERLDAQRNLEDAFRAKHISSITAEVLAEAAN